MIRRLDHVAVAVRNAEAALAHFRDHLGLRVVAVDEPPEVPVRLTYLDLGNAWMQLVEPLVADHPLVAWLDEHGEGLHHVCFGVDDVRAELQRIGPPARRCHPWGAVVAGLPASQLVTNPTACGSNARASSVPTSALACSGLLRLRSRASHSVPVT